MKYEKFLHFFRILTHAGWSANYDRRRMTSYELNSRNIVSVIIAGSLLVLLLAALSLKAVSNPKWQNVNNADEPFKIMSELGVKLSASKPAFVKCPEECDDFGVPKTNFETRDLQSLNDLNSDDLKDIPTKIPAPLPDVNTKRWGKLTYVLETAAFTHLNEKNKSAAISLDRISYGIAWLRINGVQWGNFSENRPIRVTIPKTLYQDKNITIEILYTLPGSGIVFKARDELAPAFVATQASLRRMETHEATRQENSGAVVGMMSRVLIAVFALMLFLFIDSAPESLGLGLFLGFEALAIGFGQRWLSSTLSPFIMHFSYQMGDIFRLYFFLQLARVTKPFPAKWVLYGTLLSIPYGFAKLMESKWGITGLAEIPKYRDSIVGSIGTFVCLRTLWSIREQNLPWRRIALILGALGSAQQVLGPLMSNFPDINSNENYRGFYVLYEALSVYLLALSTFTNISTLENRVQSLSRAKAKSDLIEQELELGRTVQRAFLSIPKLPHDLRVVAHHEAAVYVSGDIYFVYWDEVLHRLVVVLADVTGHGVQASLKATACYMIARNLWRSREIVSSSHSEASDRSKLKSFNTQISELLTQFSETADLPTFAGIEIYTRKRRITLFRNNFFSPFIIKPVNTSDWELISPVLPAGELVHMELVPGTIIALFSDGYIDGSRQLSRLTKFITKNLATFDGSPDALKGLFNQYNEQNLLRPNDDRTLVVLSWKQREQAELKLTA